MAMDWLHCNKCLIQLGDFVAMRAKPTYILSNCAHIVCGKCKSDSGCAICGKSPVRYTAVGSEMRPEVKLMFQNCNDHMKTVNNAHGFQSSHAKNFVSLLKKQNGKLAQILKVGQAKLGEEKCRLETVTQERDEIKRVADEIRRQQQQQRGDGLHRNEREFFQQAGSNGGGGREPSFNTPFFKRTSVGSFPKTPVDSMSALKLDAVQRQQNLLKKFSF